MVSRLMLHDPSDMGIVGVSGKGKFSIWGRMLECHRRRQEAFCILESLLCIGGTHQRFGPSLQEISQRSQNLSTVGQKAVVKVYHAEETLHLFDILRGWAVFDFGGVSCGAAPVAEIMCPRISREGAAKTHFSRSMARPLVAKAVKKASRWRRCVCLSGESTRECSCMQTHLPNHPWCDPSFFETFVRHWKAHKV
jgi:hypothetical protein